MLKITKTDKIILSMLEDDSRTQEKEMAKACKLSKDTIRYRIKRLENKGIIKGYSALVDYTKMNNHLVKLYLSINSPIAIKENLIRFAEKKKETFTIYESIGEWDLCITFFVNDLTKYYEIENEILHNWGKYISHKEFLVMLESEIYNHKMFLKNRKSKTKKIFGSKIDYNLSELDHQIIEEMIKNSRQSVITLAQKFNKSHVTITNHLRNLINQNIIYPRTSIDYEKLGLKNYKIFIEVSEYNKQIENKIMTFLKLKDNTFNIIRVIGDWKLEVEILTKEYQDVEEITRSLYDNFSENIRNIKLFVISKEQFYPNID
ncbi:Lrp/AsnC family transcriptional regulator [Candidatus Woesearchaeota archaeon]|nr:Lrp/AsnC family transcriptional regulator [Candidatus Woesearchaeota archaeon]